MYSTASHCRWWWWFGRRCSISTYTCESNMNYNVMLWCRRHCRRGWGLLLTPSVPTTRAKREQQLCCDSLASNNCHDEADVACVQVLLLLSITLILLPHLHVTAAAAATAPLKCTCVGGSVRRSHKTSREPQSPAVRSLVARRPYTVRSPGEFVHIFFRVKEKHSR